ncbi:MAG: roadblock/LC7 domain-containing protein, partial [candidate division Zixibacteria bacterium]|nr:roadblock/LC7 domain-containing protein [candidate division Zixibacteria bacterium]
MSDDTLVLYEEEIQAIDALISKMLKGAEAKCALLVDKDGHLITRQGFTHSL